MSQYSFASLKAGYAKNWRTMKVLRVPEANSQAQKILRNKDRYMAVQKTTGVPWFVIGCLHMRESNGDFDRWLHNGDRMRNSKGQPIKTVNVPAHRPPNPNVTWEQGAYDALVVVEELNLITDWEAENVAYCMEKFNGFGYRAPSRNIPSPYLWGGTNLQKRGKFTSDGHYDATAMDSQLGGMAVLKQLMYLDKSISFDEAVWRDGNKSLATESVSLPPPVVHATPDDGEQPPPQSPRAVDTTESVPVRPASRSKQVWGTILAGASSIGSGVVGMFSYINNPFTLAAFVLAVVVACVGLWLILSGRLELNKLIQHLAPDTADESPEDN
jgi:lysozyme family protein